MGLAASQARLLSITSRKSSAQFESMKLSHQKLALSRSLADVSNDYQNALNKTKLYYDFYGNGSTQNILSYDLLMRPSAINEYSPVMITNQQNRIVLSTNLATAARAAGIPQEGLDGYIDTHTRNKFIGALSGLGDIDAPTAAVIQQTEYNPKVGLGYTSDVYLMTETDNYEVLQKRLERTRLSSYEGLSANDLKTPTVSTSTGIMASVLKTAESQGAEYIVDSKVERLSDTQSFRFKNGRDESFGTSTLQWNNLSLYDILYGSDDIILTQNVQRGVDITDALDPHQYDDMINVVKTVIDLLADELEETYGLDDSVRIAIEQAYLNMDAAAWGNVNTPKLAVTTGNGNDYMVNKTTWSMATNHGTLLNYDPDHLTVHLPAYSSYNDAEYFVTAEDNPYTRNNSGGRRDYGYEPGAIWVSLPNTVISGGGASYNTGNLGTDYSGSQNNNMDYTDIDIYEYYGLDMTAEEFKQYLEDHVSSSNDAWNHLEGDGVNIARRNAMVNSIDGAKYNLALFNLYDYTGDWTEDSSDNENKNLGGNYGSINLSAFVQAWYTYFMQSISMTKLDDPEATDEEKNAAKQILGYTYKDENGNSHTGTATNVTFHAMNGDSSLISNENKYNLYKDAFTFEKAEVMVEDGIADIASFYDTIINQICEYGWTENNQVKEDTGYLQEMLQSGKMFLFKLANDNYYYQKGYSTDTFIKEIADETAIAEAEAKYKTQKARINAKEEELDVKMRNLDTEISALESEYEAVKKMISNNVQKSFTRYQS